MKLEIKLVHICWVAATFRGRDKDSVTKKDGGSIVTSTALCPVGTKITWWPSKGMEGESELATCLGSSKQHSQNSCIAAKSGHTESLVHTKKQKYSQAKIPPYKLSQNGAWDWEVTCPWDNCYSWNLPEKLRTHILGSPRFKFISFLFLGGSLLIPCFLLRNL